ncbi:hypothetical protein SRABI134_02979 [Peribacillus sp. Bi134]|nr:hypothetical protein SRABI134_02979 [Peribacillus sp. Bi134]
MGIFIVFMFCLSIVFSLLHLFHCLPWFRGQNEGIKQILEKEKGISILVPCYNEQGIIETSIKSMKSLS